MTEDIEKTIGEVTAKDSHVLCREVMSITDTMDVMLPFNLTIHKKLGEVHYHHFLCKQLITNVLWE